MIYFMKLVPVGPQLFKLISTHLLKFLEFFFYSNELSTYTVQMWERNLIYPHSRKEVRSSGIVCNSDVEIGPFRGLQKRPRSPL